MSVFGPHEQDFFKESSKNYYAASLFSLRLVCITHNKFKYKCCCNNSLNLTPDFLLCLMHVERKKGGVGQETQWASSSHTEIQHAMVFLKYYLKRQWPGEKARKPKNNLKLVFLSSDIKDNLKKNICSTDIFCVVYFSAAVYEWHWESHSAETEKVVDLLLKLHLFMQENDSEDCLILTWWNSPGGNHTSCPYPPCCIPWCILCAKKAVPIFLLASGCPFSRYIYQILLSTLIPNLYKMWVYSGVQIKMQQ